MIRRTPSRTIARATPLARIWGVERRVGHHAVVDLHGEQCRGDRQDVGHQRRGGDLGVGTPEPLSGPKNQCSGKALA